MQKERWEKEYQELKNLPSTRTQNPSKALIWFETEYLKTGKAKPGAALDIGSGRGRNSIYLAKIGFNVTAIETATSALDESRSLAKETGVKVNFIEANAGSTLPFPDGSFDLVIDMMTMHLLDPQERENYASEVKRVLKPNGYFLFYTIAAGSPQALKLFKESPGPEPHSYIVPQSGMVEKCFTKGELEELFSPLRMIHFEDRWETTSAFSGKYERDYYLGLMEKG